MSDLCVCVCVCVCVGGVLFLARYFQSMSQIQLIESVQMICSQIRVLNSDCIIFLHKYVVRRLFSFHYNMTVYNDCNYFVSNQLHIY